MVRVDDQYMQHHIAQVAGSCMACGQVFLSEKVCTWAAPVHIGTPPGVRNVKHAILCQGRNASNETD